MQRPILDANLKPSPRLPSTPCPPTPPLQRLPAPIIHIPFKPSSNRARDPVIQPNVPQQLVVALLVQEQLMMSAERRVRLAVLIEIRRNRPAAVSVVQIEDHAFADVDEETDVYAASAQSSVSVCVHLFQHACEDAGDCTGET